MTSPLIHATPAVDPNLVNAPFLVVGAHAALPSARSVGGGLIENLSANDIFFRWSQSTNPAFRIDNIGSGDSRFSVNGTLGGTDLALFGLGRFLNQLRIGGTLVANAVTSMNVLNALPDWNIAGFSPSFFQGLNYGGVISDSVGGGTITNVRVINLLPSVTAGVTTMRWIDMQHPDVAGVATLGVGIDMSDIGFGSSASWYGIRAPQNSLGSGAIDRFYEWGSTPYERLLAAEWVPTAEQTPLYLAEGVAPTLRNVQWVDPGIGGINLAAGQRVMVLV